jgi:hypothetical protein
MSVPPRNTSPTTGRDSPSRREKGDSPVGTCSSCRSPTRSAGFRFVFATERRLGRDAVVRIQVRCAPVRAVERVLSVRSYATSAR